MLFAGLPVSLPVRALELIFIDFRLTCLTLIVASLCKSVSSIKARNVSGEKINGVFIERVVGGSLRYQQMFQCRAESGDSFVKRQNGSTVYGCEDINVLSCV